jgi:hypothetical protein
MAFYIHRQGAGLYGGKGFFPQVLVTFCHTARRHMQDDRNLSFIRYFVSKLVTTFVWGNFVCEIEGVCVVRIE